MNRIVKTANYLDDKKHGILTEYYSGTGEKKAEIPYEHG